MRRAVALGAALLLAGCTSTVSGRGSGPAVSPSPTVTTPTTPPTSSAPPTGIGDPGAADLCVPVQAGSFGATFDDPQYAGSCSLTVSRGSAPRMGLVVTALPPDKAKPRYSGTQRTVEGLPVVAFPGDQYTCERDIRMTQVVLSVSADGYGTVTMQALCSAADRLTLQEARALSKARLGQRPLARPTLVGVDLCRGINASDLQRAPGGGILRVEHSGGYGYYCHGTNPTYSLGIQVVFHKTAVKPRGSTTVGGHHLVWFDVEGIGGVCQVVSVQKPTTDPAIVEGIGMYLIAKTGRPAGQQLCSVLTAEAARVLDRLGLP
jgi:hypothetical protein